VKLDGPIHLYISKSTEQRLVLGRGSLPSGSPYGARLVDPDTALPSPDVLRNVARSHDGMAGVYGAILVEGTLRVGDPVEILD
jgi:hypothetical protein